jgi:alanine racemase
MVRLGITLYGLNPSPKTVARSLKPALSLKARVSFVKELEEGERISYGLTYRTDRKSLIATIPIGYGDGYSRLLSNRASVLIKGKRAPVVGRVTMDQIMVDVTDIEEVEVGAEVVLIGHQGKESISVDELAELIGTINYEIVCMIGQRIPRVYVSSDFQT